MYEIEINDSQDHLKIDAAFLQEVAERTLAEEQIAAAEVSIALVDNATIHQLNRQYLGHDYETDVLSFLLESEEAAPSTRSPQFRGAGRRIEGEVVVSTEMALQTAGKFCWNPQDEVILYLVHGLLHLVGYDDLSGGEKTLMRSRERAILKQWNLVPRYAEAEGNPVPDGSGPVDGASGAGA